MLALSLGALCSACGSGDGRRMDTAPADRERTAAESTSSAGTDVAAQGTSLGGATGRDSVVEYYTAALLAHVGDSLARGRTTGHTLRAHPTFSYLQIRRTSSGVPEVHDHWTDVTLVQAGHGTLLSGGRVNGSHVETPGEHRGGSITGGESRPVGAGDLMIIPAGIPHQYLIPAGDSLRYITVKVAATSSR